jgi:quinol-cytochrome oxidoreductase complex cytochrome b subunit
MVDRLRVKPGGQSVPVTVGDMAQVPVSGRFRMVYLVFNTLFGLLSPDTGAEAPQSAASRLFDLRSMIGGLFVVYGIMLTVAGFFTPSRNLAKASNINLWMGLGMLVVGVFFLAWWRLRPLRREEPDQSGAHTTGTGH